MSKKNKAEPFHMISKTVTDVIPVEDTDDEEENTTGFVVNATKPEEDTEDGGSVTDIFQPLRMTESERKTWIVIRIQNEEVEIGPGQMI